MHLRFQLFPEGSVSSLASTQALVALLSRTHSNPRASLWLSLHPKILTHFGVLGKNLLSCPLRALRLYSASLYKSLWIKASTKWINANVYVRADSGLLRTHAESSPSKWVTLILLLSWRLHHDTGGKKKKRGMLSRQSLSEKGGNAHRLWDEVKLSFSRLSFYVSLVRSPSLEMSFNSLFAEESSFQSQRPHLWSWSRALNEWS